MRWLNLGLFLGTAPFFQMSAQEPQWSKGVYRLEAASCPGGARVSTSFKIAGEVGLISTLHGVAGCSSFKVLSANGRAIVNDELKLSRVNPRSDLAFLTSAALGDLKSYGLDLADIRDTKVGDRFSVPGYAYSLISTMESILLATDASRFTALRDIVPQWVTAAYERRKSPSLSSLAIYLQGPLAKGQSGAPILNSRFQVVAVVEGGAEDVASNYVWGMQIDGAKGLQSLTDGPGWRPYDPSEREVAALLAAPVIANSYYAPPGKVAQEVVLERIDPKATGHLVKTPDWDLLVDLNDKQGFALVHNHERANNILRNGKAGSKHLDASKLRTFAAGVSTASLTSCDVGSQIHITVSVRDNIYNETFSGETHAPCNEPGVRSVTSLDLTNHSGVLKHEKFRFRFSVLGLESQE